MITLGDNLYLDIDELNMILKERRKSDKSSKVYYNTIGYYSSLEQLSAGIARHGLTLANPTDIITIKEFVKRYRTEIRRTLAKLLLEVKHEQ